MQIHGKKAAITSVDSWRDEGGPKGGDDHWVDGRSAKELARAWCGSGIVAVPDELASLLNSSPVGRGVVLTEAWPEKKVRFDRFKGEPRNTDLALIGVRPDDSRIAISVEAKADEPFDSRVLDRLFAASRQIGRDKPSCLPIRVQLLGRALLPQYAAGDTHLGELRYQLLTSAAGALAFAHQVGAAEAILVIHEFLPSTRTAAAEQNARDLDAFVARLTSGRITEVKPGILYGPIHVPGADMIPGGIPLWLGKVQRTIEVVARKLVG